MKVTVAAFATLVSTAAAQQAGTFMVNTPGGAITTCSNIIITWVKGNAVAATTTVNAIDISTGNTIPVLTNVNLDKQSTTWKVNIPPGSYYLQLNDGQDNPVQSGQFKVTAGPDTSCVGQNGGSTGGGSTNNTTPSTQPTTPSTPTTPTTSAPTTAPTTAAGSTPAATTKPSSANTLARPAIAAVLALAAASFMF